MTGSALQQHDNLSLSIDGTRVLAAALGRSSDSDLKTATMLDLNQAAKTLRETLAFVEAKVITDGAGGRPRGMLNTTSFTDRHTSVTGPKPPEWEICG